MQRLTVTLDDDLMGEIDRFMASRNYQNRSEAFRDLARAGLRRVNDETREDCDCVAALVYVYDHDVRELAKRLTVAHHDHPDLSVATMHVHLDHWSCMEVAVLRGQASDIRSLATQVIAERGVRHGHLVVVPVEASPKTRAHGGGHTHSKDDSGAGKGR